MTRRALVLQFMVLALSACFAPAVCSSPMLEPVVQYSQDGRNYSALPLVETTVSAARYYRYRGTAGHPAFGSSNNAATVSLVWDTTRESLALLFISGGGVGAGRGAVTLTGLPRPARLSVADDNGEFYFSPRRGKLTGAFHYGGSTDGFVLGGLGSNNFRAKLVLSNRLGIDALRLTSGDPTAGGSFVQLNLKKPLYLRVRTSIGSGVVTPTPVGVVFVPEPAGFLPAALAMFPLFARRRRAIGK